MTSDSRKPPYNPLKQGVLEDQGMLNIGIFSSKARSIFFQIFSPDGNEVIQKISLTKDKDHLHQRTIPLPDPELPYSYLVDDVQITDPFSKALASLPLRSDSYASHSQFTFDHTFDWENVSPPNFSEKEMIIYELHVKGFTKDPSSHTNSRGTYLALIEKIPHLTSLGINAVELMPLFEFNPNENGNINPKTQERLVNYWGYNTANFHAPAKHFASSSSRLGAMTELKTLIKELHRAGIKVILDVVYNHVSHHMGLEHLDKEAYYILGPEKDHTNYTGCGNTIHANSNASMNLILSSLREFAKEYHVDGFRYDLGGALTRGKNGEVLDSPPLFEAIKEDPILSKKFHTAEPWDAAGLNKLGRLSDGFVGEWNGDFKHSIRKYINNIDLNQTTFANAIMGNPDIFADKEILDRQVHYITVHDGFSLNDLVSYQQKHNEENGEDNRDGENYNFSTNWGIEGETSDRDILAKRKQSIKNFWIANMSAKGIPLITMGDEYGLTHKGNNNPYCQDNKISWFNWDDLDKNRDLKEFVARLSEIRKKHILKAQKIDFTAPEDGIACFSLDNQTLVAFNMGGNAFDLQTTLDGNWECLLTSSESCSLNLLPNTSLVAIRKSS